MIKLHYQSKSKGTSVMRAKRFLLAFCVLLCVVAGGAFGETDGAFGPDLTGTGALRLGTRYKSVEDIFKDIESLSALRFVGTRIYVKEFTTGFSLFNCYGYGGKSQKFELFEESLKPTSLKGSLSAKNNTFQDYIDECVPYAPLFVRITSVEDKRELKLLYYDGYYRLVGSCLTRRCFGFDAGGTRELALFVFDKFGEQNGIDDMYVCNDDKTFYWKDVEKKFVLYVDWVPTEGPCVLVYPIVSETLLYPLGDNGLITETGLRKKFEEEQELGRQLFKNYRGYPSFDDFFREKVGWKMGFRGFGDSWELD